MSNASGQVDVCSKCGAVGGKDGELLCTFLSETELYCYDTSACFRRQTQRTGEPCSRCNGSGLQYERMMGPHGEYGDYPIACSCSRPPGCDRSRTRDACERGTLGCSLEHSQKPGERTSEPVHGSWTTDGKWWSCRCGGSPGASINDPRLERCSLCDTHRPAPCPNEATPQGIVETGRALLQKFDQFHAMNLGCVAEWNAHAKAIDGAPRTEPASPESASEDVMRMVHAFDDEGRKQAVRDLADRVRRIEEDRDRWLNWAANNQELHEAASKAQYERGLREGAQRRESPETETQEERDQRLWEAGHETAIDGVARELGRMIFTETEWPADANAALREALRRVESMASSPVRGAASMPSNVWSVEARHGETRAVGPWRSSPDEAEADAEHGSMRGALPEQFGEGSCD